MTTHILDQFFAACTYIFHINSYLTNDVLHSVCFTVVHLLIFVHFQVCIFIYWYVADCVQVAQLNTECNTYTTLGTVGHRTSNMCSTTKNYVSVCIILLNNLENKLHICALTWYYAFDILCLQPSVQLAFYPSAPFPRKVFRLLVHITVQSRNLQVC